MLWILIEAVIALALLVGVVVWVALPSQKKRQSTPPKPENPENTPEAPPNTPESPPENPQEK